MFYTYDDHGRFAGTSDTETPRSTRVAPGELTDAYVWNHVTWVFAPGITTQPVTGGQTAAAVTTYPRPSVPQFLLSLTSAERVAMRALIPDNPTIADFFAILDDVRTSEVDFNIPSVREVITGALYLIKDDMEPAYTEQDIAARMATILAGNPN